MSVPSARYRWVICALLFFATTINYVDRQVLGLLAPTLQHDIGWNEADYGAIVSWFTLAYALGFLFAGGTILFLVGVTSADVGIITMHQSADVNWRHLLKFNDFRFPHPILPGAAPGWYVSPGDDQQDVFGQCSCQFTHPIV